MSELLAVMWDLDGTLADSEPVHHMALLAALRTFGIEAERSDDLLGVDRRGVHAHLLRRYENMPDYETYEIELDRQFMAHNEHLRPVTAAKKAFDLYRKQGRKQAVVSNSSWLQVELTLKSIGVFEHLDGLVWADGKCRPKPSPDPYQRALDLFELAPSGAIAIEDSQVGCTAARTAGLYVVGVPQGGDEIGANVHLAAMPEMSPEEIIARHER